MSLSDVGYSPCGTVFGAIRRPYSAPCRFFKDDATGNNRIIWYFAPPGATWYDGDSIFVPRIDYLTEPPPNEFEKTGVARFIRKYGKITDRWHFPADHWHGDADDFAGLSDRAKYFLPGVVPESCPPARLLLFFGVGARCPDRDFAALCRIRFGLASYKLARTIRPAARWGTKVVNNKSVVAPGIRFGFILPGEKELARKGIKFGIAVRAAAPARPAFEMGVRVLLQPKPPILTRPGFEFGFGVVSIKPFFPPADLCAFRFGADVLTHKPGTETALPAFRFGIGEPSPLITETVKPAFRFGAAVNPGPPPPEVVECAFCFGLGSSAVIGDGTTCRTAWPVALFEGITFFTVAFQNSTWFRWDVEESATGILHAELDNGSRSHLYMYVGYQCDEMTLIQDGIDNIHTPLPVGVRGYTSVWVEVRKSGNAHPIISCYCNSPFP